MSRKREHFSEVKSEVRFWACFAVVFALLSQVLFPVQVMARSAADGVRFVICSDEAGAAPVADVASAKVLQRLDHKKNSHQGLKCADCVLASITTVAPPVAPVVPAVYSSGPAEHSVAVETSPVKARAPPRPHSCGPPARI